MKKNFIKTITRIMKKYKTYILFTKRSIIYIIDVNFFFFQKINFSNIFAKNVKKKFEFL